MRHSERFVWPWRLRASPAVLFVASMLGIAGTERASGQIMRGRVIDSGSGASIANAALFLIDSAGQAVAQTLAGNDGTFRMGAPAAAEYTVRVERFGYPTATLGPVQLANGAATLITVRLNPEAIPLDALTVEVERRLVGLENVGYYERRNLGLGRFIEREAIDRLRARTLGDILRTVPGARVLTDGQRSSFRLRGNVGLRSCSPVVFLDGSLTGGTFNPEFFPSRDIEALEVYSGSGSLPPQYNIQSLCGAIVLWTRKPR